MSIDEYIAAMNARVAIVAARQVENENAAIAARRAAIGAAQKYVADLMAVGECKPPAC